MLSAWVLVMHTFWQYRRENPQTKVGEPPPDGLPGFNSGVLLLNLDAMRQSKLYNQLLEPTMVQKLTEKYHFKGHLGDQDFFTMVGMEHPELFHVLDCTWNRQLCTWWRDHGYSDVFDQYFQCEGETHIFTKKTRCSSLTVQGKAASLAGGCSEQDLGQVMHCDDAP
ncbi:hypothetical protein DV515_00010118 [Chloebia gouldiae]|uniref:Xyloside xylosyltransferase 1 n=1 Tax=Chloebia gouldiae TaxID=44316 RepID=A0A3L8SB98_CHLGU|nr:hypothetical protein DV515_00010118 [Chloebia gouldiae]